MLMNNLDPDVAERPGELVVYGGIGRAARDWQCLRPDRRDAPAAGGRRDAAGPVGQAGRRVPHPRRRAARADRQLEPRAALGDLGPFQRARSQGPDDVRPDDRRLVDLHRLAGHRAGHLRDLRRDGPPALRRRSLRQVDPDRRPGRHGRRAAARRHHGRRLDAGRRVPAVAHRDAPAHRLCRRRGRRPRRGAGDHRARRRKERRPSPSGCSATRPRSLPELVRRGVRPDVVTDQTSAHDPVNGYLPKGWTLAEWEERRESDPKGVERAARASMAEHVRAMLDFHKPGVPTFDYGNNIRQMALEEGRRGRLRLPRLRAGLYPAAVLPRDRPVPLGRAVGRSGGHLQAPTRR